jgi:ubiquinone/menaquinone biosynthesis C-methylase UbiE
MADAEAFNAFEAAGWEECVAGYERFFGGITPRLAEPLLAATGVGPGDRVLDVASGPGFVAAAAAARGAGVVGVDVAPAMVAHARRLHPQLDFRQGDAEALPFGDGSFDALLANFLLMHLGRPERAAAEFARVLVPGGRLALTVWDVPERARFVGVLVEAMSEAGAAPPPGVPAGPPFFRFADEGEFTALLHDQGLEAVTVRTIAFEHGQPSADALWRGLLTGTVRMSALVLGQTPARQAAVRAAFDRLAAQYERDGRLELPVSVKLAAAAKPQNSPS